MAFVKDRSKAGSNFDVLPTGAYEVFITGAELKDSSSSEYQYYNVVYTIRDDIEQPGKGRKVWDIYSLSPKAEFKFHAILDALEVEDGVEFESEEEIIRFMNGKAIIAVLGAEKRKDRDGNMTERNNVKATKPSALGGEYTAPTDSNDSFSGGGTINISDDDLPF